MNERTHARARRYRHRMATVPRARRALASLLRASVLPASASAAAARASTSPSPSPPRACAARQLRASHDDAAVARGDARWRILTPVISDQVSIPDGVVGDVAEINVEVGDVVDEGHVAVVIETHKACLNVRATGHRRMVVTEVRSMCKSFSPIARFQHLIASPFN